MGKNFMGYNNASELITAIGNKIKAKYSKPSGGIPKSDLATGVQTSLEKADSALQSYTETDPTVPSWAKQTSKPTYTQDEVGDGSTYKRVTSTEKNTWNSKYSKPSGGIPKTDLASAVQTLLDAIPSPPSGFIGFKTLPSCGITGYEYGGFVNYGLNVFFCDEINVPAGTSTLLLFKIERTITDPYPAAFPLPPIPNFVESDTEFFDSRLPVYASDGTVRTDCYLSISYRKNIEYSNMRYIVNLFFTTKPSSVTTVRINFNYIGESY